MSDTVRVKEDAVTELVFKDVVPDKFNPEDISFTVIILSPATVEIVMEAVLAFADKFLVTVVVWVIFPASSPADERVGITSIFMEDGFPLNPKLEAAVVNEPSELIAILVQVLEGVLLAPS